MLAFLKQSSIKSELWRRASLMFLGNGRAGKTSLLRQLADLPFDPAQESTKFADDSLSDHFQPSALSRIFTRDISFSVWDFPGQLEYSASLEYFTSVRQAIVVLVWDVSQEIGHQRVQLFYWLETLAARQNPHLRVLLVGTKVDLIKPRKVPSDDGFEVELKPEELLNKVKVMAELAIKEVGARLNVNGPHFVSSSNKSIPSRSAIPNLRTLISSSGKSIFESVHAAELRFPSSFVQVSKDLKKFAQQQDPHALPIFDVAGEEMCAHVSKLAGSEQFKSACQVLHDVGDVILNEENGTMCIMPQWLASVVALFADPDINFPADCTFDEVCSLLISQRKATRCCSAANAKLLIDLLIRCGIIVRNGSNLLVPIALRGSASSWLEVTAAEGQKAPKLRGVRLQKRGAGVVSSGKFFRCLVDLMGGGRCWAMAFCLGSDGFVRCGDDRRAVDVIWWGDSHKMDSIVLQVASTCLGGLDGSHCRQFALCPQCVASDLFVKFGIAHGFWKTDAGGKNGLRCSRFHSVASADLFGCDVTLGGVSFAAGNKSNLDQLPWRNVDVSFVALDADGGGEVISGSFLCLVESRMQAGTRLSPDDVYKLRVAIAERRETCQVVMSNAHMPSEMACVDLNLRIRVGDVIVVDGVQRPVTAIVLTPFQSEWKLEAEVDPSATCVVFFNCTSDESMCVSTQAELTAAFLEKKVQFVSLGGSGSGLSIASLSQEDITSAKYESQRLWAEVVDLWMEGMALGVMFDITRIDLFKNEQLESNFNNFSTRVLSDLQEPLLQSPAWTDQQAEVLRSFNSFKSRLSLGHGPENKVLGWWGHKGRVYPCIGANGFLEFPPELRLDPGFFGSGFYFTQYPRYSDYYITQFRDEKNIDAKSILMCSVVLGRPYPVTEQPFISREAGNPDKAAPTLLGKRCDAASPCSVLTPHHSHYVTVKMSQGLYLPAPHRSMPDFDELTVQSKDAILPLGVVTYVRRRRVLLWLDSDPDGNASVLERVVPNGFPLADLKNMNGSTLSHKWLRADRDAGQFEGEVILVNSLSEMMKKLKRNDSWARYPSTLFRMITRPHHVEGFLTSAAADLTWGTSFPAWLIYGADSDGVSTIRNRPNVWATSDINQCSDFASFSPEHSMREFSL